MLKSCIKMLGLVITMATQLKIIIIQNKYLIIFTVKKHCILLVFIHFTSIQFFTFSVIAHCINKM